jgi:hypothetical protein
MDDPQADPAISWMDRLDEMCQQVGVVNMLAGIELYCMAQGLGANAGRHWMDRAAAVEACAAKIRKDGQP